MLEFGGLAPALGEGGHADADRSMKDERFDTNGGLQGLDQALGNVEGLGRIGKVGNDGDELITAHASERIAVAQAGEEAPGDLAEVQIPDAMRVGIVHCLEVVEVKERTAALRRFLPAPASASSRRVS